MGPIVTKYPSPLAETDRAAFRSKRGSYPSAYLFIYLFFGLNEQVGDSPEGKGVSTKTRDPDKKGCTYIIPMTTTLFFRASGVRPSLIPELDIRERSVPTALHDGADKAKSSSSANVLVSALSGVLA